MSTEQFVGTLLDAIAESLDFTAGRGPVSVKTFTDANLKSFDEGLVVTLPDGAEYQVTVVPSTGAYAEVG